MQPSSSSPSSLPPSDLQSSRWRQTLKTVGSHWLTSWVVVLALIVGMHYFVFSAYHVVGSSMVNTLHDGDYLIVSRLGHTAAGIANHDYIPGRGEIVVFHYPKQPTLDFVKRVVALPGERVVVRNCEVTVYNTEHPSGFNPDTNYELSGTCTEGDIDETVPAGNVYVLGDNRTPGGSSDSREWGFLPSQNIIGNAGLRLYPLDKLKIF